MAYEPLIGQARLAKRMRKEMQCDPQWVLDLAAERDKLLVERDGANERAGLLLKAKNDWADRARAAEAELDQARRTAEHWKAEHLAGNAVIDQLRAEVEALRGIQPEAPPRPPYGHGLPRYGLRWNGPQQPVSVPMDDGYWTPWHLANGEVEALRLSQAAADVLAERRRQVEAEGWTPEHDDEHGRGELSAAAACYAVRAHDNERINMYSSPGFWPWDGGWKPGAPRCMLIKAGALILAEIERLDRAAMAAKERV